MALIIWGGVQYTNSQGGAWQLRFFPTAEGYVIKESSTLWTYAFNYTDHLGNVRLSYKRGSTAGLLTILEENNYYPFGLKHSGYNSGNLFSAYKYKYNGKELQDELGLNMFDYGARNYDPALGRWMNVDPLAEISRRNSPYVYALNNPVYFIDPDGMANASNPGSNNDDIFNKRTKKDPVELFPGQNDREKRNYREDDPNHPPSDYYVNDFNYKSNYIERDGDEDTKDKGDKDKEKGNKKEEGSSTATSILAAGVVLTAETSEVPPVAVAVAIVTTVTVVGIKLYDGVHAVFQYAANFKNNFAKTKPGKAAEVNGAEHTSGARASTANTHEAGQTRKQQVNRDKKRQNPNWRSNK